MELLHLRYLKPLLGVKQSLSNLGVYGELGNSLSIIIDFIFNKRKEGLGFYVACNSLGHIATRTFPGAGMKFPSLPE